MWYWLLQLWTDAREPGGIEAGDLLEDSSAFGAIVRALCETQEAGVSELAGAHFDAVLFAEEYVQHAREVVTEECRHEAAMEDSDDPEELDEVVADELEGAWLYQAARYFLAREGRTKRSN